MSQSARKHSPPHRINAADKTVGAKPARQAKAGKRDEDVAKASGKSRKNKAAQSAGKQISPRVAKLMARFKDARLSDVSNKVFVATSDVHGKGLFAAKNIKANTVLGRLQGMPTYDDGIYVLWISEELGLELTNDFKFINHNSKPNAAYSDLDVMVLRDVEAGEELLHDYGW